MPPDRATQRARAFAPPMADARTTMKEMDVHSFCAFASITSSAVGGDRAAMRLIAGIAQREIAWQMFLAQPLFATTIAASASHLPRLRSAALEVAWATGAGFPPRRAHWAAWEAEVQHEGCGGPAGRRNSGPDSPTPPPKKRAKRGLPPRGSSSSSDCGHRTVAAPGPGRSTGQTGKEGAAAPPYCRLWERLGGRNVPSWEEDHHDGDGGKGRDVGSRL
ncbi:hypothetical protein BC826DRAFT_989574 [Russula brevipes]|nr:hypothetical protein BC826DRAFT_989574 [Russula brevipes]